MTVTDTQIKALLQAAAAAGDEAMVHCCWVALGERAFETQPWPKSIAQAREACEEALVEGDAMDDDA